MKATDSALAVAAAELYNLARFELSVDPDSSDAVLLAQLSFDLRVLSDGGSLRSTCLWRTFAEQFPRLFQKARGHYG